MHHLPRVANDAAARNEIAPFAVQIDEPEVDEPVQREHPHHREMPVARAGEPTAERETRGNRPPLERIAAKRLAAPRERGIGIENAQSAPDHDRERDRIHPMGDPNDGVMAFHASAQ